MKFQPSLIALAVVLGAGVGTPALAAIAFDQNVTPGVIFGSGNANGSFTTDRANGVEIGLRGKLRHNPGSMPPGNPENIFNSNGDGTYSFVAGIGAGQPAPTAVWSFEWSINTNFDGTTGLWLNDLTYELGLDTDSSQGTSFLIFDPINGTEPIAGTKCWDHSLGTNATGDGAGIEVLAADCRSANALTKAASAALYDTRLGENHVAQNSWKPHWFIPGFNPDAEGAYDLYLLARDSDGDVVARTDIQIQVPEPGSLALAALALTGLGVASRRRRRA